VGKIGEIFFTASHITMFSSLWFFCQCGRTW